MDFKFLIPISATSAVQTLVWLNQREPSLSVQSTLTGITLELRAHGHSVKTTLATRFRDAQWHHCVVYRNGADFSIAVDGMQSSTVTVPEISQFVNSSSFHSIIFGRDANYANYFLGYLDEFRIWGAGCLQNNSFLPVDSKCKNCSCLNGGICVAAGQCACRNASFVGANCEESCFGVAKSDASVCSSRGTCTAIGIIFF